MYYHYFILLRLHQPTGFMLLFWPCAFALALTRLDAKLLALFFIGSIVMRSAGCVVNDITDRNFDKHVARTKHRPLASGKISIRQAVIICGALCLIGLSILLQLPPLAIYLSLGASVLVVIYPFAKRFSRYPQAFLAITFNMGSLIAYVAAANQLDYSAILLYIACCLWTLGYDTIYAYQDIQDDKKLGIGSTAVTFETHFKTALWVFYSLMILAIYILGYYQQLQPAFWWLFSGAALMLMWQVWALDLSSPIDCAKKFKLNTAIGAVIFISFYAGKKLL